MNPIKKFIKWVTAPFKKAEKKVKAINWISLADKGIVAAEKLKQYVNSPLAKGAVLLIKTPADDVLLSLLQKITSEIPVMLEIGRKCISQPTNEAKLVCLVFQMRELDRKHQNKIYLKIACYLTKKKMTGQAIQEIEKSIEDRYKELKTAGELAV